MVSTALRIDSNPSLVMVSIFGSQNTKLCLNREIDFLGIGYPFSSSLIPKKFNLLNLISKRLKVECNMTATRLEQNPLFLDL
jgi:hypothetical protein